MPVPISRTDWRLDRVLAFGQWRRYVPGTSTIAALSQRRIYSYDRLPSTSRPWGNIRGIPLTAEELTPGQLVDKVMLYSNLHVLVSGPGASADIIEGTLQNGTGVVLTVSHIAHEITGFLTPAQYTPDRLLDGRFRPDYLVTWRERLIVPAIATDGQTVTFSADQASFVTGVPHLFSWGVPVRVNPPVNAGILLRGDLFRGIYFRDAGSGPASEDPDFTFEQDGFLYAQREDFSAFVSNEQPSETLVDQREITEAAEYVVRRPLPAGEGYAVLDDGKYFNVQSVTPLGRTGYYRLTAGRTYRTEYPGPR